MDPIISKGTTIQSKRTGKKLICYNVMPVMIGETNEIVRYDYSFYSEITKKCKTIKSNDLKSKISTCWFIV